MTNQPDGLPPVPKIHFVYVAGPFTAKRTWEVECNVRRAEQMAFALLDSIEVDDNVFPIVPHTMSRFFHGVRSGDYWIAGTLELLDRCDSMIVCDGWEESTGTLNEIEHCKKHGIPFYYGLDQWLQSRFANDLTEKQERGR